MPRLVNENLPDPPSPGRTRTRYLLISLGIHAAVFFALVWTRGGRWLGAELSPSPRVAIEFSTAPAPGAASAEREAPAKRARAARAEPAKSVAETIAAERARAPSPADETGHPVEAAGDFAEEASSRAASPAQILAGAGGTAGGTPAPPYPRWARERGWEGRVVLELEILTSGRVGAVTILESTGHPRLDQHTANWAKDTLRFEPATMGGVPVATTYRIALRYDIKDSRGS